MVGATKTCCAAAVCGLALAWAIEAARAADPPALNPFAKPGDVAPGEREDAIPGYVEMSDGSIHYGRLYLTRDKRIKIYDAKLERQREIPLNVVKEIRCTVLKEWVEREWRNKENALDEKVYTGRSYPSREYNYTLTLQDGRQIAGSASGIVYLTPAEIAPTKPGEYSRDTGPEHYLLHKRDKGENGTTLAALKYVKTIKLGEEAFNEGKRKAGSRHSPGESLPANSRRAAR